MSEHIHDGSCLLPNGLHVSDMVEVCGDDGVWTLPLMAGHLHWGANSDVPIRKWRLATVPAHQTPTDTAGHMDRLEKLASEYRPTMDKDVLHSWAADVVAAIRETSNGN